MSSIVTLIKLSENDKRVLICLCLLILLIIVLIGYLQKLVSYIMKRQGMIIDKMMYDITKARVITKEREFVREASYKSHVYFVKQSWISATLLLLTTLVFILYTRFMHSDDYSYFVKSWNELTFELSWPTEKFFGLTIPNNWPDVVKYPDWTWSIDKYFTLLITLIYCVAGVFYLVQCQALLARRQRIWKLKGTFFTKNINNLDNSQAFRS